MEMTSSSMQLPTVLNSLICFNVIVFVLDTDRKENINRHCCVMFTYTKRWIGMFKFMQTSSMISCWISETQTDVDFWNLKWHFLLYRRVGHVRKEKHCQLSRTCMRWLVWSWYLVRPSELPLRGHSCTKSRFFMSKQTPRMALGHLVAK